MTTPSSYDIVLAGKGGQGVLFLSRVVGEAGLREGIGVRTTETHGMAMRGGSVLCFVRIGKGMGPLFRKGMASLLMALHEDEAALGRVYLAQNNPAIINTRDSKGSVNDLIVDADSLAASVGNPRSANLALLGAATTIGSFPVSAKSIESVIQGMGTVRYRSVNLEIFRLGRESQTSKAQRPREKH